jgi:metal-sulfur cluster biosynthetic enzyme
MNPVPSPSFETELWDALRRVVDPELGLNLVDLGLIYSLEVREGRVHVVMTVTTPGCPMEQSLTFGVETALLAVEGVQGVEVTVVHDPPWSPDRMSPEGRAAAGIR